VAGIGIAYGAEILVKAAEKSRATAHATVELQDGAIQFLAELDHGVCLVDVGRGKELRRERSKGVLSSDQDLSRVLAAPGNVEKPEQHACGANAQKLVEISRYALPLINRGNLSMAETGNVSVERVER
jgi:hypothetical protein